MTQDQQYHEGVAIWRVNEKTGYAVKLCLAGHQLSVQKLDTNFGGSWLEAELAAPSRKLVRCYGAM